MCLHEESTQPDCIPEPKPAGASLRPDYDATDVKNRLFIFLYFYGDGEWWTEVLCSMRNAYLCTDEGQTLSNDEMMRRMRGVDGMAALMRSVSEPVKPSLSK